MVLTTVIFDINNTGRREVWVNIEGSVGLMLSSITVTAQATALTGMYVREITSTEIEFGMEAYQNSGGALDVTAARFSVGRIR